MSSRWKTGQSGNPKGRPRKTKSSVPDLKRIIEDILSQQITVTQGDSIKRMSIAQAGIQQVMMRFAKGDAKAPQHVLNWLKQFGVGFGAVLTAASEDQSDVSRQIYDELVARLNGTMEQRGAVIAPPDLLDDDPSDESDS